MNVLHPFQTLVYPALGARPAVEGTAKLRFSLPHRLRRRAVPRTNTNPHTSAGSL